MSAKQLKVFQTFTTYFLVAEGSQPKDQSRYSGNQIKSVKAVREVAGKKTLVSNEDVFSIYQSKAMMNQIIKNESSQNWP